MKTLPYLLILTGLITSCTVTKPIVINRQPAENKPVDNYDEDLSLVRPRYKEPVMDTQPVPAEKKVEPKTMSDTQLSVNKEVEAILDTMSIRNRAVKYAAGYRIQIYVGNVRADADAARLFTYQTYPELIPYMNFTAPTYRIRIGDFMTRIDAERYVGQLKAQFPSASIQSEKIEIRKSIFVK